MVGGGGTDCDASSKSSAATLALKVSLTSDPTFISGYALNCLKLDVIVGSMSFPHTGMSLIPQFSWISKNSYCCLLSKYTFQDFPCHLLV